MKNELEKLRVEWAKAPFTAKAVAGAYITPLLDLLQTIIESNETMRVELDAVVKSRAEGMDAMRKVIAKGEAIGALPDWMLGELKQIAGADNGEG